MNLIDIASLVSASVAVVSTFLISKGLYSEIKKTRARSAELQTKYAALGKRYKLEITTDLTKTINEVRHLLALNFADDVLYENRPIHKILIPLGEIQIGRDPENEIVVEDSTISRVHCKIIAECDLVSVIDCDSTNGSFLNGNRLVPGQSYQLAPGDQLKFGLVCATVESP